MPAPGNPNAMMIDALTELTRQLRRNLDFHQEQEQKAEKTSKVLRAQQEEEMRPLFDANLRPTWKPPRPSPVSPQETLFGAEVGPGQMGTPWSSQDPRLSPDSEERTTPRPTWAALRQEFQQQQKNQPRVRAMLGALGTFQPPRNAGGDTDPNATASLPPETQSGGTTNIAGMINNPMGGPGMQNIAGMNEGDALSWAILGEHGGPAFIRNTALDYYGFGRSIKWAQNAAGQLSDKYDQSALLQKVPFLNQATLGAAGGAMRFADENKAPLFAAWRGAQMAKRGISNLDSNLQEAQATGQQLGYGPPAAVGQALMGHHNPLGDLGTAAQVGAAYNLNTEALQGRIPGMGFGNGLTGSQAQDVTGTLAGQGFGMQPLGGGGVPGAIATGLSSIPVVGGLLGSLFGGLFGGGAHGDAAMIGQDFMRPLMERFPGLKAQDLGQFTPSLRNAGTSIQQLSDQLDSMGVAARATKETVGEFASSLAKTGETFESMGSSPQGGYAVGAGFTAATAIDPQIAAQFGQSPLFQGIALSHGILPSGIGDLNSGAFTNTTMAELQMMQKATAGIAQNKYQTINGRKVLVQNAKQAQYDQIAQMTGVPSNIVKRMLGDQSGIQARALLGTAAGDATNSTGMWAFLNSAHGKKLNKQQYAEAESEWNQTIAPNWKGTGISHQEMQRLGHISGMRDRMKALQGDIQNASKNDQWNQIQDKPGSQTVQVQFTGLAAKYFQQVGNGPSPAKQNSNAGMAQYNAIVNQATGDLTKNSNTIPAGL